MNCRDNHGIETRNDTAHVRLSLTCEPQDANRRAYFDEQQGQPMSYKFKAARPATA